MSDCELIGCRSPEGTPATVSVNENMDDGSWRVKICHFCAITLELKEGDDLPDYGTVMSKLEASNAAENAPD